MASVSTLPLSDIVDVEVIVTPQSPASPTFNIGLIVGTSPVIGSVVGSNQRVRTYTSLSQMLSDGFSTNSPEYIAASIYFGQLVRPQKVMIGRQDLTALQTVAIGTNAGENYAVGDIVTPTQAGAQLGKIRITEVNAGVPTSIEVVEGQQGTGYAVENDLPTTGGSGTGLEINIIAVGETPLQAIQACRLASPDWYLVASLSATDEDSIAIGEWAQSQTPQLVYFYTTSSDDALNGVEGNVFSVLKAGNYSRAFGIYSTTQNGLYPNNIYAAVAAMGVAMGLNTGLANSYFTMKFKTLVGIATEPLSESQLSTITSNNGNANVSYGNTYSFLVEGTVADGQFFDEILQLDMLASDYQYSLMDLLTSRPSIAQSEVGQSQLINVVNQCNARSASRGFLSPGVWNGASIPAIGGGTLLANGTALPNGYQSVSDKYVNQSASDRAARKAMPIYVALIESGATHSILIGVAVQQ